MAVLNNFSGTLGQHYAGHSQTEGGLRAGMLVDTEEELIAVGIIYSAITLMALCKAPEKGARQEFVTSVRFEGMSIAGCLLFSALITKGMPPRTHGELTNG